ncbi:hypothetical protein BJ742DRAFT_808569 [Cladochytrium replicatum]|nr:hypothetical protein BJ742DRAFT_808569 [Cladochytrium replicatum]
MPTEQTPLLRNHLPVQQAQARANVWIKWAWRSLLTILGVTFILVVAAVFSPLPQCSQPEAVSGAGLPSALENPTSPSARTLAEALSGAVQINTEGYDSSPDNADGFLKLHEYLEKTFPKVHKAFTKEVVNRFSLLFTLEGSDPGLKPLMLNAHLDTVPVDPTTLDRWEHDPLGGVIADDPGLGPIVHGRGAFDDKGQVIAQLFAMENLLPFKPKRTVILAYGHDEETRNTGATAIANVLLERYGVNGIEFLVDEGSPLMESFKVPLAVVSTAEKGHIDIEIEVEVLGGHSSLPPKHTSIGILSEAVVEIENNPFTPYLSADHPLVHTLKCVIAARPKGLSYTSYGLLKLLLNLGGPGRAMILKLMQPVNPLFVSTAVTHQAVTVFRGGIKKNALPETALVNINHRVANHMRCDDVVEQRVVLMKKIAKRHNLQLIVLSDPKADQRIVYSPPAHQFRGNMSLIVASRLEPSPMSPAFGPVWDNLASTIRGVAKADGSDVLVLPAVMPANTDTRSYWNLTSNIFRFNYAKNFDRSNLHTVGEMAPVSDLLLAVRFFQSVVLNF